MAPDGDASRAAAAHVPGLLTWVVGPGVLYLASEDPLVRANAARDLEWRVTVTTAVLGTFALTLVTLGLASLLVPVLLVVHLVASGYAAYRALAGDVWAFPATLDLL